jgi:hypothetical protein
MSAEFVDALKGYEYYLRERGAATIDDVNHYLKSHGRKSIRLRTYGHYGKLLAHGFRSYIPINKFDVFQTLGRIQMAADRRRYERRRVEKPVRVSRDAQNWQEATITDMSLVGFGILVPGRFPASRGERVWVELGEYSDIPAILVWKAYDAVAQSTALGLRGFEFIAKYRQVREQVDASRLRGMLRVSRAETGRLDWRDVYRILEKTNEVIDAVSSLIYSIDDVVGTNIQLAPPLLVSIKFGSPGVLQTKIDVGVAEMLDVVIGKVQFWSLERDRFKLENQRLELKNVNLFLDVARNAISFRRQAIDAGMTEEAISAIMEPVRAVFGPRLPPGLFAEGTLERGILTQRVLPVVTELVAGDDPDFRIEASFRRRRGSRPSTQRPRRIRRRTRNKRQASHHAD